MPRLPARLARIEPGSTKGKHLGIKFGKVGKSKKELIMKKILVAFDDSEGANLAIAELRHAGLPDRAEAKVISIADVWLPVTPVYPQDPAGIVTGQRLLESQIMAEEALKLAKANAVRGSQLLHQQFPLWNISNEAHPDSPAWGIISFARQWQADLITLGSHGRTPLERFFLGSVSYKIAAEATCSVRIVKPNQNPSDRPNRILIAVDGSEDSEHAVDEVLTRKWRGQVEVHLLAIVDARLKSSFFSRKAANAEKVANAEDHIKTLFEGLKTRFSDAGLTAHFHILEGDPKTRLLGFAGENQIDCIFLGARGQHHGNRLYLGTVAAAISTRAPCTVEIVRSPAKETH
jgi:nucleotide-binding universal stress UspA family protein